MLENVIDTRLRPVRARRHRWPWLLAGLLAMLLAFASRRLLGGYTGDVLGAVEQVFELGFVLGAAAAFAVRLG